MAISTEFAWCEAPVRAAVAAPDRERDDAEIIEGFLRSGDDELFGLLVQRYKDRVFRLVASTLGPAAENEAEDLVQEVFITVYRKLETFRGDCAFSTWLYRLARNRAIDACRRPRPFANTPNDPSHRDSEPSVEADPGVALERSGRDSLVLRHVNGLGEPRRTVLFLFYWMGCDVDEISGLTEIPAGTVKSHLFRARRELAKQLRPEAVDG